MKYSNARSMNRRSYFDVSRGWLLLKVELFRSWKAVIMTLVIIAGLVFFIDLLLASLIDPGKVVYEHSKNYAFNLLIGGFVLSSLAFSDLSNPLKRQRYLILPVSALEKLSVMWLLTSLGWIILFTMVYTVYTWFVNLIGPAIFSYMTFEAFDPLDKFNLTMMKYYFVLQGVFLVGATRFEGYVFPKTLFVLIVFLILCGSLIYLMLVDIFLTEHECTVTEDEFNCELVNEMEAHWLWWMIQWMFWWVLAPLCWGVTYLGLKEKEV